MPENQRVLLFLYHSYEGGFFWWESLKMLYLLCLVVVRVLTVRLEGTARLGLFLALVIGFLFLMVLLRPHRFRILFFIELGGLQIVVLATYILQFALLGSMGGFSA